MPLKNSDTNTEGDEDDDDIPACLDRRPYPEAFEALWREYQPIAAKNATKGNAFEVWGKLSAADKEACRMGLVRYVERFLENGHEQRKAKRLASFIKGRSWEGLEEKDGALGRAPNRLCVGFRWARDMRIMPPRLRGPWAASGAAPATSADAPCRATAKGAATATRALASAMMVSAS